MRPADRESLLGKAFSFTLGRIEPQSPWRHLLGTVSNTVVALGCAFFGAHSVPAIDWTMTGAITWLAFTRYLTISEIEWHHHFYTMVLLIVALFLGLRCYWLFE